MITSEQIEAIEKVAKRMVGLLDLNNAEEFVTMSGIIARDLFQMGFDSGKKAGYQEGYKAGIERAAELVRKKISE